MSVVTGEYDEAVAGPGVKAAVPDLRGPDGEAFVPEVLAFEALAPEALASDALAMVWELSGERLLWASPAAEPLARALANDDGRVYADLPFRDWLRRASSNSAPRDGVRLERVRLGTDRIASPTVLACRLIALPDREALLTTVIGPAPVLRARVQASAEPERPHVLPPPATEASEPQPESMAPPSQPEAAAPPEMPAAPETAPSTAATVEHLRTLPARRFVWEMDAGGRFTSVSEPLAQVVGAENAAVLGQRWSDIVGRLVFDPTNGVAAALAAQAAWSNRPVLWRIEDGSHLLPVALSGVPVRGAQRSLEGFRGFGIPRPGEIVDAPASAYADGTAGAPEEPMCEASEQVGAYAAPIPADMDDLHLEEPAPPSEVPDIEPALIASGDTAPDATLTPVEPPPAAEPSRDDAAAPAAPDRVAAEPPAVEQPAPESKDGQPAKAPVYTYSPSGQALMPVFQVLLDASLSGLSNIIAAIPTPAADRRAEPDAAASSPLDREPASTDDVAEAGAEPHDADSAVEPRNHVAPPQASEAAEVPEPGEAEEPGEFAEAEPEAGRGEAQDLETAAEPRDEVAAAEASEAVEVPEAGEAVAALQGGQAEFGVLHARIGGQLGAGRTMALRAPSGPDTAGMTVHRAERFSPESGIGDARPVLSFAERGALHEIARALGARLDGSEEGQVAERRGPADIVQIPQQPRTREIARLPDQIPLGLLVHRGEALLYANRFLLDLAGSDAVDAAPSGETPSLFAAGLDANLQPGQPPATALLIGPDGSTLVECRATTVEWGEEPASLQLVTPLEDTDPALRMRALELDLAQQDRRLDELAAILDLATDGIVILDASGHIMSLNSGAERLFGYERDEITGEPVTTLLAPESHAAALAAIEALTGESRHQTGPEVSEVTGLSRAGMPVALSVVLGGIGAAEPSLCMVIRDVSHRSALVAPGHEADPTGKAQAELSPSLGHEIRSSLNAIIGFVDVLIEERFGPVGSDRYKPYLHDLRASGGHVIRLVDELLDPAPASPDEIEAPPSATDLNEAVAHGVAALQPVAARERIVVRTSFALGPAPVAVDEGALRQIVGTVLSHAIGRTDAGGQVIASTALTDSGGIAFRVRDTGAGMSAEGVEAALRPFRDLSNARHDGGTGFGLPLAKALVEAGQGTFAVTSRPHEGTLVEVVFPLS